MFSMTLVTPEKKLFTERPIEEAFIPAYNGELNILPGHAPLMTTMTTGILRYRVQGESKFESVAISWGYCQVNPSGINVLAETAESPEEIDLDRVNAAIKKANEQLAVSELQTEQMEKYQRKIMRANVRSSVASLKTH